MKTLYLHIGTPKTGTTYLQTFFSINNEALGAKGFYYPVFDTRYKNAGIIRNAHFLVGIVRDENGNRLFDKEAELEDKCFAELLEYFESYDNIILSDEQIWYYTERCRGYDFWEKLRERLNKNNITLKVIVYLRRQDAFVQSYWAQKVKSNTHEVPPSVREYMNSESFAVVKLNYYRHLNRISSFVGMENVIVRVYERGQFVGGSISADFLASVGLEYDESFSEPEMKVNSSISGIYLETKKELNKVIDTSKRGGYIQSLVTQAYMLYGSEELPASDEMLTFEEAKELLKKYRSCNVKVGREYLGRTDRKLFLEKPKRKGAVKEDYELTDYVRVLSEMLSIQKEKLDRYYNTINRLTPEVKELRAKVKTLGKENQKLQSTIAAMNSSSEKRIVRRLKRFVVNPRKGSEPNEHGTDS